MNKKLYEKRAALLDEMDALIADAEKENRAFSAEEQKSYDEKAAEIARIDKTIEAVEEQERRSLEESSENGSAADNDNDSKEAEEERAFADYIRGVISDTETRADGNFTKAANGAVIPSSIANKIITRVEEICPIYQLSSKYNVGGTLTIPYYDESAQSITMAYATEFTELESTAGEFKSISLTGYLAGVLSLISKSLVNNSQFDIVSVVINRMAISVSRWIEKELLFGTKDKIEGLSGIKEDMTLTTAAAAVVTADELIDLQEKIPDVYQGGCIWIMNKALRTAIRKLKDGDGNYLLNKDATSRWGYTLFGKDVYVSDAMPKPESGKPAIFYGDFGGLAVKLTENMAVEVLREKYATQHAIGVVGWIELDSKIENGQKLARLNFA
ncbi:MAG: phage major capsid protein [Bacteroides sp.]|nr:phage major capsid protein [Bacteroides sp.]